MTTSTCRRLVPAFAAVLLLAGAGTPLAQTKPVAPDVQRTITTPVPEKSQDAAKEAAEKKAKEEAEAAAKAKK